MTYIQPRASYSPIGRQPFRPGQWQGFKGVSRNTTYIQNNFFGNTYGNYNTGYNYGNYNTCCDNGGGNNKWMNWLMGIGVGTTLLGGILKLFGKDSEKGGDEKVQQKQPETAPTQTKPTESEPAVKPTVTDTEPVIKPEDEKPIEDTLKVDKQDVKTTTSYTVQHGDTWSNLIMAKYKDENGNPISFADAKELWTQLKQECGVSASADGMPSSIEFPNEFKNYKLDIDAANKKLGANEFKTQGYKGYDGSSFSGKTQTNYTATGTINGKSIGNIKGNAKEVSQQLRAEGFADKDIKAAMESGEIKIQKQK